MVKIILVPGVRLSFPTIGPSLEEMADQERRFVATLKLQERCSMLRSITFLWATADMEQRIIDYYERHPT